MRLQIRTVIRSVKIAEGAYGWTYLITWSDGSFTIKEVQR